MAADAGVDQLKSLLRLGKWTHMMHRPDVSARSDLP
jgi:hypothetical protein